MNEGGNEGGSGGSQARSGDTVRIHYTGRLDDGSVFDSSEGRDPLEFTLGTGQVIAGFDQAVTGMAAGDEQTVTIPAADAYGPRREEMVFTVPRIQFPPDLEIHIGQKLEMQQGNHIAVVSVTTIAKDEVTLDANHPLADQDLTFDLKLVEIR